MYAIRNGMHNGAYLPSCGSKQRLLWVHKWVHTVGLGALRSSECPRVPITEATHRQWVSVGIEIHCGLANSVFEPQFNTFRARARLSSTGCVPFFQIDDESEVDILR